MSLWQQYQEEHVEQTLIPDVPESMRPIIYSWLFGTARTYLDDPYGLALEVKNVFRVSQDIPSRYANNYSTPTGDWRFANFLMNIADEDPQLFFTILDYVIHNALRHHHSIKGLQHILDQAGHKYMVYDSGTEYTITERISPEQAAAFDEIMSKSVTYASEFRDAFKKLYGPNPEPTESAHEAFQALESALKHFLGDDKGKNLGATLSWLRGNRDKWKYACPTDGQTDAEEHFLSLLDFVNKSYRGAKHGQADKQITVTGEHAAVILRMVSLAIYELESTIELK